jgi:hypothetical protein
MVTHPDTAMTLNNGFLLTFRHPERSEAKNFLFPWRQARAQSKDLVSFIGDSHHGFNLLRARPPSRSLQRNFLRQQPTALGQTRSFDYANASIRSAQDDGTFKEGVSQQSPQGLR